MKDRTNNRRKLPNHVLREQLTTARSLYYPNRPILLKSNTPKEMIAISIANIGSRAVTVHEAGLKFPDGKTIPYLSGPFAIGGITLPERIEGFDQISVFFEQSGLTNLINQNGSYPNKCYVRIGGGKTFDSKIKRKAIKSWFGQFE